MTEKGKAIEILENQKNEHYKEELNEAFDMAISALKESTWQEKFEKEYLFESIKEDMAKLQAENERLLKEVEALKGGWIPIEDGYPEELKADDGYIYPSDYVLTFDSHGMYGTSRYWGNRTSKRERPNDYLDWMDLPSYRQDILAWQPLPEPYKKGE